MARTRRTLKQIISEVRVLLKEENPDVSNWSDEELKIFFNQEADRLEMRMGATYEGFGIEKHTTDLIADQKSYQIPNTTNRISRVLRVLDDGSEFPLERNEKYHSGTHGFLGSAYYIPEYRVRGEYIVLDPAPSSNFPGGLAIEIEVVRDRVMDDNTQVLPSNWPIIVETVLILSTALAAFAQEGAQAPGADGLISSLKKRRDLYEAELFEYLETRSRGRVVTEPFHQGD